MYVICKHLTYASCKTLINDHLLKSVHGRIVRSSRATPLSSPDILFPLNTIWRKFFLNGNLRKRVCQVPLSS